MAPSRNPSNPAPRTNAAPYETRARHTQDAGSSNNVSNEVILKNKDTATDGDSNPTYATARRPRTKGAKEFCTEEQSAALLAFFWRYKGYPDGAQILEISARIGKSVPSVRVWLQNHRHPRLTENTPWFRMPGAIDPEIDPSAPHYPKNPTKHPFGKNSDVLVDALDVHPTQPAAPTASTELLNADSKEVKRVKPPGATSSSRRGILSKSAKARDDSYATGSFAGSPLPGIQIDRLIPHKPTAPESSCSSGDSNGSEASSPRSSPPAPVITQRPPNPTDLFIAEVLLDLGDLRIHARRSVPAPAINPPFTKQFDQVYASQQRMFGPIRIQNSSVPHLRDEDHTHAWRVANPYGRLPPATKQEPRATKFVRFTDTDDNESKAGSPSMLVSQERPASNTPEAINKVPGMASYNAIEAFHAPSQVPNAPKITQIALPCNCFPVPPPSPITPSRGTAMAHTDRSSHIPCILGFKLAPHHERVNATTSYGDLAFAPHVPVPVVRYQDSGNRQSLTSGEGDTIDEEDIEAIAPLCSIAGGVHGECRLSRDVASPARQ